MGEGLDNRLADHLAALRGSQCWSVIGDRKPEVHLGFGDKILRARPLTNPTLTNDERAFEPSADILINCRWLLQLLGKKTSAPPEGGAALKILVGRTVEEIVAEPPAWDLRLQFAGAAVLVVLASKSDEAYDNYSVGVNGTYWEVRRGGETTWS